MRSPLTILFSSAGRRTELLQCFRTDARELGIAIRVLAAELNPDYSAASRAADVRFAVPKCASPEFIPAMLDLCKREHVDLIIPTIDTELEALSDHREAFAAVGTRVVVSDAETVRIARNKEQTASFLKGHGIPAPRTGRVGDVLADPAGWRWPLILKPVGGSSSIGIQIVEKFDGFESAASRRNDYVAQEFWRGREFTTNMFFDHNGNLRAVVPHWRKETRGGEVSKGITWRQSTLIELGERIGAALPGARGPLCFQAIVAEDGQAAVFEINARFGGGFPLAHAAGARFSKWLLEEACRLPSTAGNDWTDRYMMLRYDAAIFAPAPAES